MIDPDNSTRLGRLIAYLDNQLKPRESAFTWSLVRRKPGGSLCLRNCAARVAGGAQSEAFARPGNFTLTPEMAGYASAFARCAPDQQLYPVLRLASDAGDNFLYLYHDWNLACEIAAPAPMTVAVSQDRPVMAPFGMAGRWRRCCRSSSSPAAAEARHGSACSG